MYERIDVWTSERMDVHTYEQMSEWTYEQMDVMPYGWMTGKITSRLSDWCANQSSGWLQEQSTGGRFFEGEHPNHYNLDFSAYIFDTILSKVALEKFPVNVELADLSW